MKRSGATPSAFIEATYLAKKGFNKIYIYFWVCIEMVQLARNTMRRKHLSYSKFRGARSAVRPGNSV
jgi:hypothetical protein